jgi:hypothetical protein
MCAGEAVISCGGDTAPELTCLAANANGSGGFGCSTFLTTEHPETVRAMARIIIAAFTVLFPQEGAAS